MPILNKLGKILEPEIRAKNIRALGQSLLGKSRYRRTPSTRSVFVIGCSRSGTTVTFETLAAVPQFLSLGVEIPEFWNGLYRPLEQRLVIGAASAEQARPEHRAAALRYFYQRLGRGQVLDENLHQHLARSLSERAVSECPLCVYSAQQP